MQSTTESQTAEDTSISVNLEKVTAGLAFPTFVTNAGNGSGDLYITEQRGTVRVIENNILRPGYFLDISQQVRCCGEQGLLSIAFHPDYAANRFFFVYYTDTNGDAVIARYRATMDGSKADSSSQEILLKIEEPTPIHNGGQLQFGPDGFLYIGIGDGGSFGQGGDGSGVDPENHGQRLDTLLGKILRIDVDHGNPYAIPASNPFRKTAGVKKEIWALGFKNPWRFSFDRLTGDLYLSDVGRSEWEEIDFQPHDSPGGENYGWHLMEGPACFQANNNCNADGSLTLPAIQYTHKEGCAVIGGYVYRGRNMPGLAGTYLYADFCTGKIWGAKRGQDDKWATHLLLDSDYIITTFGEDENGELYVSHRNGENSELYRFTMAHGDK